MNRGQFSSIKKLFSEKHLENSICHGGSVIVDVFYDEVKHVYYQVQVKEQGNSYRETEPCKDQWEVKEYGPWKMLG